MTISALTTLRNVATTIITVAAVSNEVVTTTMLVCEGHINKTYRIVEATKSFSLCNEKFSQDI